MLKHTITAGTEEMSDVRITVAPGSAGREIFLEKLPHPRFRAAVLKTAERVLDEEQVDGVRVWISDFGALEFVIEARLRAALREAGRDGT